MVRGLLRVTKDVARKFGCHGVVGRKVADPVDLALVYEAHFGEVVAAFFAGNLADPEGETGIFVIGLLPVFKALGQGLVELFVGLKDEDPIVAAIHGVCAGSDSGNDFANHGTRSARGFFQFVIVGGVDDNNGFIADAERVESTFEGAGMSLRVHEAGDLGHV